MTENDFQREVVGAIGLRCVKGHQNFIMHKKRRRSVIAALYFDEYRDRLSVHIHYKSRDHTASREFVGQYPDESNSRMLVQAVSKPFALAVRRPWVFLANDPASFSYVCKLLEKMDDQTLPAELSAVMMVSSSYEAFFEWAEKSGRNIGNVPRNVLAARRLG